MLKKFFAVVIVMAVVAGFSILRSEGEAVTAKKIFEDSKCNSCHSVESQGLEAKKKSDKYPDLSNTGSTLTSDFIIKFLKKDETIDGKKHPIAFKGEEAELQTLADWLASLKTEESK